MKVSDVSFAISTVISEIGIAEATIEQSTGPSDDVTFFDIQRPLVNGEELWFCFRVIFHYDSQTFEIATRQSFVLENTWSRWELDAVDEASLRFWLRPFIEREDSILEELTRP